MPVLRIKKKLEKQFRQGRPEFMKSVGGIVGTL